LLVYLGASLIALSILIMYGVIAHTATMAEVLPPETWFITSAILAPTGYVLQDVVADAMTVEAVPTIDEHGNPIPESDIKAMHITMQTLGRVAIISGLLAVAMLNVTMFAVCWRSRCSTSPCSTALRKCPRRRRSRFTRKFT
jgi:hypothetical protein